MVLAVTGQPQAASISFTGLTSSPSRNLNSYLDHIWQQYFSDIACVNEVQIAYCHPWKSRLGLIRLSLDNATSFIGINALLQHQQVPECVLITTVAHELTHYAHGFGSPLPRLYKHPHANNVVNRELEHRGLGEYVHQSAGRFKSPKRGKRRTNSARMRKTLTISESEEWSRMNYISALRSDGTGGMGSADRCVVGVPSL